MYLLHICKHLAPEAKVAEKEPGYYSPNLLLFKLKYIGEIESLYSHHFFVTWIVCFYTHTL